MIEEVIRKIISEELQKIKKEIVEEIMGHTASDKLVPQYGESLTVDQVAKLLNISKAKVYETR